MHENFVIKGDDGLPLSSRHRMIELQNVSSYKVLTKDPRIASSVISLTLNNCPKLNVVPLAFFPNLTSLHIIGKTGFSMKGIRGFVQKLREHGPGVEQLNHIEFRDIISKVNWLIYFLKHLTEITSLTILELSNINLPEFTMRKGYFLPNKILVGPNVKGLLPLFTAMKEHGEFDLIKLEGVSQEMVSELLAEKLIVRVLIINFLDPDKVNGDELFVPLLIKHEIETFETNVHFTSQVAYRKYRTSPTVLKTLRANGAIINHLGTGSKNSTDMRW
jgi:hypothetical protein